MHNVTYICGNSETSFSLPLDIVLGQLNWFALLSVLIFVSLGSNPVPWRVHFGRPNACGDVWNWFQLIFQHLLGQLLCCWHFLGLYCQKPVSDFKARHKANSEEPEISIWFVPAQINTADKQIKRENWTNTSPLMTYSDPIAPKGMILTSILFRLNSLYMDFYVKNANSTK